MTQGLKHDLFVQENEAFNKEPKIKMCSHFFGHFRGNTVEELRGITIKNGFCEKAALLFMKIM